MPLQKNLAEASDSVEKNSKQSLNSCFPEMKESLASPHDDTLKDAQSGRNGLLRRTYGPLKQVYEHADIQKGMDDEYDDTSDDDEMCCTYPPYDPKHHSSNQSSLSSCSSSPASNLAGLESIGALKGHTDYVQSIILHRGFLFSGSADGSIRVWCTRTHECVQQLDGHVDTVERLVALDNQLISASSDDTIRIWSLETWMCLKTLQEHSSAVYSLCLFRDNAYLASGSWDSDIRVWKTDSWTCETVLQGHSQTVYSIIYWNDYLISGSYDKSIKVGYAFFRP